MKVFEQYNSVKGGEKDLLVLNICSVLFLLIAIVLSWSFIAHDSSVNGAGAIVNFVCFLFIMRKKRFLFSDAPMMVMR